MKSIDSIILQPENALFKQNNTIFRNLETIYKKSNIVFLEYLPTIWEVYTVFL